jgi:gas vesicle protein
MNKFLAGMILGALAGAATVLLLTPQSGNSFQESLRGCWQDVLEEGRRAADERRAELEAQFAEAKRAPRRRE